MSQQEEVLKLDGDDDDNAVNEKEPEIKSQNPNTALIPSSIPPEMVTQWHEVRTTHTSTSWNTEQSQNAVTSYIFRDDVGVEPMFTTTPGHFGFPFTSGRRDTYQ